MIKTVRVLFISNYYIFIAISAFLLMIGIGGGLTITYTLSALFALTVFFRYKYSAVDTMVLFFIIYSITTFFFQRDYPIELLIRSIRDQIFPISFYFFARNTKTSQCDVVKNMIYPLAIVYIIGFYLFFMPPSWYIEYKLHGNYNRTDHNYFEITRMSAFWPASYFVGYSSLFVSIYVLIQKLYGKKMKYYNMILIISLLSLFFSQQRVSIAFFFIFLLCLLIYRIKRGLVSIKKLIVVTFVCVMVVAIIFLAISYYMPSEYIDYLLGRSINNEGNLIEDRISQFSKYINTISFWGAGLGKYSHNALDYDLECISDCEYIRLPNEIGLFGLFIFLLIAILSILIRIIKTKNYMSFEIMCVMFYLIAMIGATPLEGAGQQPYMLWYCLGKLQRNG